MIHAAAHVVTGLLVPAGRLSNLKRLTYENPTHPVFRLWT